MINANLPWVESPFFYDILKTKNLTPREEKIAVDYHEQGYVIIPGLLPQQLIDQVRDDAEKKAFNNDFPLETYRDERRVQDFWQKSEATKELACYPDLLKLLRLLYDKEPVPFQTLNFKVGSQQRAHSDTIHFSSLPARYMCGIWVALEDVTDENGPLFYYPGSHKLTEYNFSHIRNDAHKPSYDNYKEYEDFMDEIMRVNKFEKQVFHAKKGDALIWSSNIVHGGSPLKNPGSTRWSQVTHYFFEDCFYYTPMLSNMVTNQFYLRNRLINIKTGKLMEQTYNGVKIKYTKSDKELFSFKGNDKRDFFSKLFK